MRDGKDSKRFQIPSKALKDSVKDEITKAVLEDLESMHTDRREYMDRQERYLQNWDDFITPNRKGPWEDSSNFHVPFTMEQALLFHARLYGVLFDIYPYFYLHPTEDTDLKYKEMNSNLMQWILERLANRNEGIECEVDKWLWDGITIGQSIGKLDWEELVETFVDVVEKKTIDPVTGAPTTETDDEGGAVYEEKEEEKVIYSGPRFRSIRLDNFYMPVGYSVEDAPVIIERLNLSKNDLMRLKDNENFFSEAVDTVIDREPSTMKIPTDKSIISSTQEELSGIDEVDANVNRPSYKVLEWYGYKDVNGDGYEENVVCWVEEETGVLLGWNYVNRIHPSGRPPYYVFEFMPRSNRPPLGLVELLWSINQEIDAMHNLRIDSETIQVIPWFTVKESRTLKADDIMIAPGRGIPVEDHDDLAVPKMPQTGAVLLQEEGVLTKHGERLGVSDLGHGQVPSQVGPLGTATGAVSMLNEMNKRLSVHITRLRKTWSQLLKGVFQLTKQRIPLGTVWRVTGEDGRPVYGKVESREEFAANVDFHFVAPSASLNQELEKQNHIAWLQLCMNPLLVQLGVTGPTQIYNAAKDVAKAMRKPSVADYVQDPNNSIRPQSLEEEVAMILQGMMPIIVPNDDHAAKIQGLMQHAQHPDLAKAFSQQPEMIERFQIGAAQAIQEHQRMLEATQAQAAGSSVSGLEIAPTMANRVAGGPTSQETPAGQGTPMAGGPNSGYVAKSGGS